MESTHLKYFPEFAVLWIALGLGIAIALSRVRVPSTKLLLIRCISIAVGLLFLGVVWFFSGSTQQLPTAAISVALIVVLTFLFVRVCPRCAATVHPRYFIPASYCPRCGARLVTPTERDAH
jgi:hypothetical protein